MQKNISPAELLFFKNYYQKTIFSNFLDFSTSSEAKNYPKENIKKLPIIIVAWALMIHIAMVCSNIFFLGNQHLLHCGIVRNWKH